MAAQHPDSTAIERIGARAIQEHFDMTRAGVAMWKQRGVPKNCRRPLALLGKVLGHEMPELPAIDIPNVG